MGAKSTIRMLFVCAAKINSLSKSRLNTEKMPVKGGAQK
jgi:hypothetical protein